jgi:hypothetical protein
MANLIKYKEIFDPHWFPASSLNAPGGIMGNASTSPKQENSEFVSCGTIRGSLEHTVKWSVEELIKPKIGFRAERE